MTQKEIGAKINLAAGQGIASACLAGAGFSLLFWLMRLPGWVTPAAMFAGAGVAKLFQVSIKANLEQDAQGEKASDKV